MSTMQDVYKTYEALISVKRTMPGMSVEDAFDCPTEELVNELQLVDLLLTNYKVAVMALKDIYCQPTDKNEYAPSTAKEALRLIGEDVV